MISPPVAAAIVLLRAAGRHADADAVRRAIARGAGAVREALETIRARGDHGGRAAVAVERAIASTRDAAA